MSKSEDKIAKILKDYRIFYKREYTFPDLLHKGKLLRFDFAIILPNKPIVLLEYDSEIHFQQVSFFHKKREDFKRAQERDRIKNKYCLLKGIKLIRIPYWELENLDIEKIFCTPEFIVRNKYHNDLLCPPH